MGVIIVSLIAASIGLSMLLKGLEMPPEPSHQAGEDRARTVAVKAIIAEIERVEHDMAAGRDDAYLYVAAAAHVMDVYRTRIETLPQEGAAADTSRHTGANRRKTHVAAIKAERKALFQIVRRRELSTEAPRKIVRELDLLEARQDNQSSSYRLG